MNKSVRILFVQENLPCCLGFGSWYWRLEIASASNRERKYNAEGLSIGSTNHRQSWRTILRQGLLAMEASN